MVDRELQRSSGWWLAWITRNCVQCNALGVIDPVPILGVLCGFRFALLASIAWRYVCAPFEKFRHAFNPIICDGRFQKPWHDASINPQIGDFNG